jgi:hypothetical protein
MSKKPSDSPAHPYEPEPHPILDAWPEFWWMSEEEQTATIDGLARKLGGEGYLPRPDPEQEYKR